MEYTRLVLLAQKGQMGPDQVDFLEMGGSYGFLLDMAKCQLGWRVQGLDPSLCARDGARGVRPGYYQRSVRRLGINQVR